MILKDKIKILAESAKYDVSCSSSGSSRANSKNGIGNASIGGICHSWSEDGRCISLLKILFSNNCIFDCAYCINRRSNDIERATFTVDEMVNLTINFYKRNYIEGLFLSSGIYSNPNETMNSLYMVAKILREKYKFNGYIHLKAIPGADPLLIKKAGFYADRMSVNIELPSEKSLKILAPQKSKSSLLVPMKSLSENILDLNRFNVKNHKFVPAGQSTQLIVGASPESDYKIIKLSENLYDKFKLKRVYYSAFLKVNEDNRLPNKNSSLLREHRLYQADWLLRFYKFKAYEIFNKGNYFLDEKLDPKLFWALNNFDLFPVEINRCDFDTLIRVPGIGVKSAYKIFNMRREKSINFDDLKKINVVLKRAKYFITCNGRYMDFSLKDPDKIKQAIYLENKGNLIPLFQDNLPVISIR
ncbi:putative DNA modification/repair radical SAM protein [Oceanotoga teriensis]|uniref:DNA modification/repair radical SAM protein n=1 Tax=Oceanotoga teriensis TaxID=515440 RepID=A0AA45HK35_9BACT|nr:putative DNA modification/repair radical SAM protein [Oceanotoga teriensis]MDO7975360.1 putative DNA modification/repair radical SAM protein [Oceanotoga teriensis]PWJ96692.1 putative DNA modification/repair radical SAM protein [Oceanotoga teriensis]